MKNHMVCACAAMSMVVAGCVPAAVPLEIDTSAVSVDDATITVVVYADDSGGCDALQFVATPNLPVVLSAVAPFSSLDIPRAGAKLVVVDAVVDEARVARGCIEVGANVDNAARRVVLAPTLYFANVEPGTLVVADPPVGASASVVDAAGAAVANAAVRARVLDSHGDAVGEAITLTADDAGHITVAPTIAPAGPVRVELVVERPGLAQPTRLAGFAPPTVIPVVSDVALRPFATTTGTSFAGVDATGVVVVDVLDGVAAAARTVLPSLTARLAGVVEGAARQWVIVDAGTPALVGDVDGVVLAAAAPALADDGAALRLISAGDCAGSALPAIVSSATEQAVLTLVDGALVATPFVEARILSSACVVDDSGDTHRVLVLAGDVVRVVDLGAGLGAAEAVVLAEGLERSAALLARHDDAFVSVEHDGAEVLLRTLKLVGGVFVDAGAPLVRVPSTPLLVAHGAFGGNDDLAVLDGAVFGVGTAPDGAIAAGFATRLCSPSTCADAIAADIDDDGRVELLVPQAAGGAIVRFR
jgi:hypothetical protein